MRKPAHSHGMLLSINETKHGRQHLHGRARHARRGKHPTCSLRRIRAYTAWRPARTPRLHRFKLVEGIRSPLIRFLEQNMEVFAWKQEDMGRVDPTVITHRLNVNPYFKPVKQKRRSFAPERQKAINEEVGK